MNGELPLGWSRARIGDIATLNPRHPRSLADSLMVSFAPMAALDEFRPDFKFLEERPLGDVRRGFTHFAEGDVLFAKITPCMENGKGAVAKGLLSGIGCGTTELIVLRPNSAVDPEYLYQFLAQPSVRAEAKEHFTSTAGQARVPKEFIEGLEIPIAPIPEQKQIVVAVAKLHGKADNCRRHIARSQALLAQFRQAVLDAACSGRITADWRRVNHASGDWSNFKLSDLGEVTGGITKHGRRTGLPLTVPYLRVANVYTNRLELATVHQIGVTRQEFERALLATSDLLFVEGNGSLDQIGRVALWDGSIQGCVHQNHLIKFRAGKRVIPEFILVWMMAPIGRYQLVARATSTAGLNTLSISKISDIPVALPGLEEQNEIVRRVTALFACAATIEARLRDVGRTVDRLQPSILDNAFRGTLKSLAPTHDR